MFGVAHSSGCHGLTGVVLLDSIVFMRDMVNRDAGIVNVARRLVDEIFVITGIGVTAVYRGGVTFGAHTGSAKFGRGQKKRLPFLSRCICNWRGSVCDS